MKVASKKKVRMVCSKDPQAFQAQYNSTSEELKDMELEITPVEHSECGFWACFHYVETEKIVETVEDEFALEGIYFTCKMCRLHDLETDGRKKWCKCKYSPNGVTNLEHGACEYFYKLVKQGKIDPMGV